MDYNELIKVCDEVAGQMNEQARVAQGVMVVLMESLVNDYGVPGDRMVWGSPLIEFEERYFDGDVPGCEMAFSPREQTHTARIWFRLRSSKGGRVFITWVDVVVKGVEEGYEVKIGDVEESRVRMPMGGVIARKLGSIVMGQVAANVRTFTEAPKEKRMGFVMDGK